MFRFVSKRKTVELKKAYLANYNVSLLQRKLDLLMVKYPEMCAALPKGMTAKKLLIGNFKYLTKVYCAFTNFLVGKTIGEKSNILSDCLKSGFKYDSHRSKIAKFLTDKSNGFTIYNCVYCDLEDVRSFTKANGQKVRKFETEHVLDKGECPLVALSLYNFVPSCKTCNGADLKGTKIIGDSEAQIAKLSPTSEGYDFDGKVNFEVRIVTPGAADLDPTNHKDDFEIYLNVKENIYQKTIDLFELKSRYNVRFVKTELLKWWEKRRKYPKCKIQQYAADDGVTYEEKFEEIFELNLRKQEHYPFEKARREVMRM